MAWQVRVLVVQARGPEVKLGNPSKKLGMIMTVNPALECGEILDTLAPWKNFLF